jgi:hypothetical protein
LTRQQKRQQIKDQLGISIDSELPGTEELQGTEDIKQLSMQQRIERIKHEQKVERMLEFQ